MLLDKTNTKIQGFKFTIRKKNEIVPEFDINSSLDNSNKNNDEWSHQGNNISNDINNYIIDKNVLRSTFKLTRHPFLTGRCRMTLFLKALNLYERIEPQVENKELSLKACVFLEITELVNVDIKNFLHRNGENQHISTEKEKKEGEYFYPDPKSNIDIERDVSRTQTHSGSEDLFYDYLYMIGKYVENMGKPVFFIHPKHCMAVLINYEKYGNLKKTLEKIEDENSFCNCGNTNCQGEENFYINEMRN